MTLRTPNEWFAAARIMATQKLPYFSAAIMGLVPFKMEGLGTLGVTDRGVLYWDPALFKKWSVENLAWVLIHEALHYMRDHAGRRVSAGAEHEAWNLCGDAESNDDLLAAGAKFPPLTEDDGCPPERIGQPSGVLPKDLGCADGRLAEEYYASMRRSPKSGPGGQGNGGSPQCGKAGCGSGSGAAPHPAEANIPSDLGKSKAEQKRIQRTVAEAVRATAQKGRGSVPSGIQRWAEETLGPSKVPWQQKLAQLCRNAVAYRPGAGDYRYDRPSRRQSAFGYGSGSPVFPAMRQPIPRVAVVVDTSGSMGTAELQQGLKEVKAILAGASAQVDFFACDSKVHSAVKVRTLREVLTALKGGGGTDMAPAFRAIAKLAQPPEVIICATDGMIGDPGPKPRAHVVWLHVGGFGSFRPPWGEVVRLEN